MKLPALAAALALAASPALAQSARVVDGDTLRVDGVTYRLWGIDAPESGQPCADGWPAGRAATEHLRALFGERHVTCEPRTLDRYGRTVAVCHVDGRDLGADMVADGHAWAFVRYSRDTLEPAPHHRLRGVPVWFSEGRRRNDAAMLAVEPSPPQMIQKPAPDDAIVIRPVDKKAA